MRYISLSLLAIILLIVCFMFCDEAYITITPSDHIVAQSFLLDRLSSVVEIYKEIHGIYPEGLKDITTPVPYFAKENLPSIKQDHYEITLISPSHNAWVLLSTGFDRKYSKWSDMKINEAACGLYDPTNGSYSGGDIFVSDKKTSSPQALQYLLEAFQEK